MPKMQPVDMKFSRTYVSESSGIKTYLAKSLGILTSFFTEKFLAALSIQVSPRNLLFYVLVVQFIWILAESPLRQLAYRYLDAGLGFRYANFQLIDFMGQTILFLTFGQISNVLFGLWASGVFSAFEVTIYGITLVIIGFAIYTQLQIMYADLFGLLALFEKSKHSV